MLLGSDIDGVIIDIVSVMRERFLDLYGYDLSYELISDYKIEECTGLTDKQVQFVVDESLYKVDLPVYADAEFYMNKYMKTEDVIFITSRNRRHSNETFLNLAKYFPLDKFRILFEGIFTKASFVRRLKLDFFVEDRVDTVIDIAGNNPNCTVLIMDRPWNKDWDESRDYDNVTRVKGWKEIIETIETFKSFG